jgi:ClpP class serine protease
MSHALSDRTWAATDAGLSAAAAALASGRAAVVPEPAVDGLAARIYARGLLTREAGNPIARALGASTYQGLTSALGMAIAAGATRIVLDIDSPGGEVAGCHDCAAAIAAAGVETVAEVRGVCASAAYWLASACDRILVGTGAELGAVGAYVGLPPEGFAAAAAVSSLSPRKNARDDQWQALADDCATAFLTDVARWRGFADAAAVSAAYAGGAMLSAPRAIALGLADGPIEGGHAMPKSSPAAPAGVARAEAIPPTATAVPVAEEAPAVDGAPALPSVDELRAKRQALELELAAIDAMLKSREGMEDAAPDAPPPPPPSEGKPAMAALAARVAQLEAANRDLTLDRLTALGRLTPGDRALAALAYEHDRPQFDARWGSSAAAAAVPLGRVSHGQAAAPVDPREAAHQKVLAYAAAHNLDPVRQYHIAAAAAERE